MQNYKLHLWYLSLQLKQKIECVCVCAFSQAFIHRTHMDLLDKVGLAMKLPQCLTSSKRPLKKHIIIWRYFDIVSNPWECSSNRGLRWWWLKMMACFYLKQKLQNMFFFAKAKPLKGSRVFCQHQVSQPQHHNTFHIQRFGVSPGNVQVQVVESQLRDAGGSLGTGGWEANSTPWN